MPSAGPDWIIKGEGRTARARGVVLSPGGATVRDAEDEITGHRDAGLTAMPLPGWILSVAEKADGLDHIWLEPLSPSIGTVIHGVDCANLSDLETRCIRHTWLERKRPCSFGGMVIISATYSWPNSRSTSVSWEAPTTPTASSKTRRDASSLAAQ